MFRHLALRAVAVLLGALTGACSSCGADPTVEPAPSATAEPSAAPVPSAAPAPSVAPAPASPGIEARCETAAAEASRALGELAEHRLMEALGHCIGVAEGAWMLMPVAAEVEEVVGEDPYGFEEGELHRTRTTVRYELSYLTADGERHREPEREHPRTVLEDTLHQDTERVQVLHTFDWDGDGNEELVVRFSESTFDENESSIRVLTFADGAIQDYAPVAEIPLSELVDYDEDGRADILTTDVFWPGEYVTNADGSGDGAPPVLFHSLPDGTFSSSDEIATRYLRTQCPAAPASLVDPDRPEASAFAVACARLWGRSQAEVLRAIDAELAAVPDPDALRDGFRDALVHAAGIEPPLRLE